MTTFQTPISDPPISAILVKNKPIAINVIATAAHETNGSMTGSQEFTIYLLLIIRTTLWRLQSSSPRPAINILHHSISYVTQSNIENITSLHLPTAYDIALE